MYSIFEEKVKNIIEQDQIGITIPFLGFCASFVYISFLTINIAYTKSAACSGNIYGTFVNNVSNYLPFFVNN